MKRRLVIGVALVIFVGLGVCGIIGVTGFLSTTAFQATASATLSVSRITPVETPTIQGVSPSLTPLPGQVGVRPSQTAYALTLTAYPTVVAFYTSAVPTMPILVSEGTATKYIKAIATLQTLVSRTHPFGSNGLCNDGKYTSIAIKQDACHYDGGVFLWWGPTPVK